MADITSQLALSIGLSSAPVEISGFEGGYVYGTGGGVSLVVIREGALDDGRPVMVARTARAARIQASPESHSARTGEVVSTTFEGQSVRAMARIYWADGSLVDRRDVLQVERWLFDVTGRMPIHMATDHPEPRRTIYGSLVRDESDWGVDAVGFQFDDQVDGSWFEGGRSYMVEWTLQRKDETRERLSFTLRVNAKSLLSSSTSRFGRRSSS